VVIPSIVLRSRSTMSADGDTRDTHWKSWLRSCQLPRAT
jgi:hypothetical protein